jgi:hypothetical protein
MGTPLTPFLSLCHNGICTSVKHDTLPAHQESNLMFKPISSITREMNRPSFSNQEILDMHSILEVHLPEHSATTKILLCKLKILAGIAKPAYTAKVKPTMAQNLGLEEPPQDTNNASMKKLIAYDLYIKNRVKASVDENTYELAITYMAGQKMSMNEEELEAWNAMMKKAMGSF